LPDASAEPLPRKNSFDQVFRRRLLHQITNCEQLDLAPRPRYRRANVVIEQINDVAPGPLPNCCAIAEVQFRVTIAQRA
jgi:hypothetical protein